MQETAQQERWEKVRGLPLYKGSHSPGSKFCVTEMVAYVAGERWSDSPRCACPILCAFARTFNDYVDDTTRETLKPFVLKLIGTRSTPAVEQRRMLFLADSAVRVFAPLALEAASQIEQAKALRSLASITDKKSALAAESAAWKAAGAAWNAVGPAWNAAGAARSAAVKAAGAARSAAWSAAGAAESAAVKVAESAAESAARRVINKKVLEVFEQVIAIKEA